MIALRRAAIGFAALAALVGILLLATGHRPHDPLHLLYGTLALLAIPVAGSLARQSPGRAGLYHAFAGLLLLGIGYRLLTTG